MAALTWTLHCCALAQKQKKIEKKRMSSDRDCTYARAAPPPSPCNEEVRPKKRRRMDDGGDAAARLPSIPDYLWALVLDCLPYQSVLNCASTSKSMLRDVMPLISELHLESSRQLRAGAITRRYRDVRDVYVYSLVRYEKDVDRDDDGEDDDSDDLQAVSGYVHRLDHDTAIRAVPFLCHLPKLERAFLGGMAPDELGGSAEGYVPMWHSDEEDGESMAALIRAFSGAFRAGALPGGLHVMGLCCPRSGPQANLFGQRSSCLLCREACRSFPPAEVVDFECDGLTSGRTMNRRGFGGCVATEALYGLDVCLGRDQIEEIVRERPGGAELLASEARLFTLLGRGKRYVVVTEREKRDGVAAERSTMRDGGALEDSKMPARPPLPEESLQSDGGWTEHDGDSAARDEGESYDDGSNDAELYVVKYTKIELEDIQRCIEAARIDVRLLSPDRVTEAIRRSFAADEDRDPVPPRERCYLAAGSFVALKNGIGLPIDEADFLNDDEWDRWRVCGTQYLYDWRFS